MRTREEILNEYYDIFTEVAKLEKEILSNEKKNQTHDLTYNIERALTISALRSKLRFIQWLLNDD